MLRAEMPNRSRLLPALLLGLVSVSSLAGIAAGVDHPKPTDGRRDRPWMRKGQDANLPEIISRRARLAATYCGQCHSPPPPELHSGDEWRWLIVRMDMRAWASRSPSVRVASNEELSEIAKYYDVHSEN